MDEKNIKNIGIGLLAILAYIAYTIFGVAAGLAVPVAIIGYFVHDYYTFQHFLSDWVGSTGVACVIILLFMGFSALNNR
ncbi:hypothetical protein [Enterobacter roggenkampii]|uniref:hypothetical protein n=1 Tax=Enterobacter roggenkampii TaxID=1812935 RepID=UPI0035D4A178